ncbi:MAG: hypothetical protein ABIH67_03480 [Candidatus Uhrbacteria bacterium]
MNSDKAEHTIIAVSLFMIFVYVVVTIILLDTQADEVTLQTIVQNSAPSIDSVYISDAQYGLIDNYSGGTISGFTGGTTKTIHVNGIISDNNDENDISSVAVVFYRSDHSSAEACSADKNDCYINNSAGSCTIDTTYGDSTQAKFDCPLDLEYYIDPTNWTVYVKVEDQDLAYDTDSLVTKNVESFLSLNIPALIDFNTLALGDQTTDSDNSEMIVTQYGNSLADLEVSGTDLTCSTFGTIPIGNVEWALSDVAYGNASGYDLTGIAVDTNIAIGLRTDDLNPVTKTLYWNMAIPVLGVKGTCAGTVIITTIIAE